MNIYLKKAELYFQLSEFYNDFQSVGPDDEEIPALHYLICKHVIPLLIQNDVDFEIRAYKDESNTIHPVIFCADHYWTYLGGYSEKDIVTQLKASLIKDPVFQNSSDFAEIFQHEHPFVVANASIMADVLPGNSLFRGINMGLNQPVQSENLYCLGTHNDEGLMEGSYIMNIPPPLQTILNDIEHPEHSLLTMSGRKSFQKISELKPILDPLLVFFSSDEMSNEDLRKLFDPKNISAFEEQLCIHSSFKSIGNKFAQMISLLSAEDTEETISLVYRPMFGNAVIASHINHVFKMNLKVTSQQDFEKVTEFFSILKNKDYHYQAIDLDLPVSVQEMVGTFYSVRNLGTVENTNLLNLSHYKDDDIYFHQLVCLIESVRLSERLEPAQKPVTPSLGGRF